jgi:uncharacterized protein (DUF1684 family)
MNNLKNEIKQIKKYRSEFIRLISVICVLFFIAFIVSCESNFTPEQKKYNAKIENHRKDYNDWMKSSSNSPFNLKSKVQFHDLNYFDIDSKFVFTSKLTQYEEKDTITIFGTKGEPRKTVRFGYLTIHHEKVNYKINVYEGTSKNGEKYYSIWFTDLTTNIETYGVGRYIDFELNENRDFEYVIDFNLAYNPYCAYNSDFSCAIPTKEDFINIAIKAGEKKFHD